MNTIATAPVIPVAAVGFDPSSRRDRSGLALVTSGEAPGRCTAALVDARTLDFTAQLAAIRGALRHLAETHPGRALAVAIDTTGASSALVETVYDNVRRWLPERPCLVAGLAVGSGLSRRPQRVKDGGPAWLWSVGRNAVIAGLIADLNGGRLDVTGLAAPSKATLRAEMRSWVEVAGRVDHERGANDDALWALGLATIAVELAHRGTAAFSIPRGRLPGR